MEMNYAFVFVLTVAGFLVLYFGGAWMGHRLTQLAKGKVIDSRPLKIKQQKREIVFSLISIVMFGLITLFTVYLINHGILHVTWTFNWWKLPIEIIALFLWNEIHFYLCHRLLHTKWLYKHVHYLHHQSVTPTSYSTYSFHFAEALLLGSVMTTALILYSFSFLSLLTLPLMSMILNVLGHYNFDLFPERTMRSLLSFTRRHSYHHSKNTGNYGFFLPYFDLLFSTHIQEKERKLS
ncbi:sterol desaturase family protein [Paenibacillus sp. NPDC058071]|uniref:sterol desaturase family protein n=1 Tax=Paenibacillus sp. NPDC058071 TaxID=3346326 RepID=UPI0036DBC26B